MKIGILQVQGGKPVVFPDEGKDSRKRDHLKLSVRNEFVQSSQV